MEYIASAKNIKISPRKVRLVADSIRPMTITKAITQLMVSRKRGAVPLKKVLDSAVANAVNNNSAKKDDLKIKSINVTEGIRYKRYHFAGRGRTRPYMKRTSHINIILEDSIVREMPHLQLPQQNEGVTKKVALPVVEQAEKVVKNEKNMNKEKKPADTKVMAGKGGKK